MRETGQAVIDACFFAYLPAIKTAHPPHVVRKASAFYETASSVDFDPDIFLGPNMHWGQESGVRYAEPFKELKIHGLGKRALDAFPI